MQAVIMFRRGLCCIESASKSFTTGKWSPLQRNSAEVVDSRIQE